jgi:hypothetical protein
MKKETPEVVKRLMEAEVERLKSQPPPPRERVLSCRSFRIDLAAVTLSD